MLGNRLWYFLSVLYLCLFQLLQRTDDKGGKKLLSLWVEMQKIQEKNKALCPCKSKRRKAVMIQFSPSSTSLPEAELYSSKPVFWKHSYCIPSTSSKWVPLLQLHTCPQTCYMYAKIVLSFFWYSPPSEKPLGRRFTCQDTKTVPGLHSKDSFTQW